MEITKKVSLVRNKQTGERLLKVECPYNPEDIALIKSMRGKKPVYRDGKFAFWTIPISALAIETLTNSGFTATDKVLHYLGSSKVREGYDKEVHYDLNVKIPGLKGELYPFQEEGVAFIEAKGGKCILADEMGLGKTVQSLAWLQMHPELRPAVIVVPATLKRNWAKEALKWMKRPRAQLLYTRKADDMFLAGEIIIVNYDILDAWADALIDYNPKVLITDECHYYKSSDTRRTKAVKKLAGKCPHIIQLSGTPIVNRPIEFFNAIKLINDGSIGIPLEKMSFAIRYCNAQYTRFGWKFDGASNTMELNSLLIDKKTGVMLRRLKKDVLKDLPDKTYSVIPFEIDNRKEYEYAEEDFIAWVSERKGNRAAMNASRAEVLAQIEALKQIATAGKMAQVKQWIRDFLEDNGKLVIFCTHTLPVNQLMEEFRSIAVKIDGSSSANQRVEAVDRFQNDDNIRLFVGNIRAAGLGITLTAASNVAILELPWSPGELVQAADRLHRIGQKDNVTVYYLVANATIEERIADLLDNKRTVLDAVLDGRTPEEGSLFNELMAMYS